VGAAESAKALVWAQSYLNSFNASALGGDSEGYLGGDEGRLRYTPDKGQTWISLTTPADDAIVTVFAGDRGQVLIATRKEIWASFDRGGNWPLHLPIETGVDFQFAGFAPGDPDTLWLVFSQNGRGWRGSRGFATTQVSVDRGQSWQPSRPAPALPNPLVVTDGKTAWARAADSIFLTINSGESWQQIADIPLEPGDWIVSTKGYQAGLLVATKRDHLFRVLSDGSVNEVPGVGTKYLLNVFPAPDGSAYAVADPMYLWHTTSIEGGKWEQQGQFSTPYTVIRAWPDGTFFVGASAGDYFVLPPPWSAITPVFKVPGSPTQVAVTANDGRGVIATDQNTLLFTNDRGASWNISMQLENGVIAALAMSATGTAVAVAEDGRILLSKDAGATWAPSECGRINSIEFGVQAVVSVLGFAIIESSKGRAPTQQYNLRRVDLASCKVDALGRNEAFVLMNEMPDGTIRALSERGELLDSIDGYTWKRVASLPQGVDPVVLKSMWWLDAQRGWIVGDGGVFLATLDGANFTQGALLPRPGTATPGHRVLNEHPDLTAVWFTDVLNGFVYGKYSEEGQEGDYHAVTSDGGRTWTPQDAIGMAESGKIAMGRADYGILLNTSGLGYITGIAQSPALAGTASEALDGVFAFTVKTSAAGVDITDDSDDAIQLIVESGGATWRIRPDTITAKSQGVDMQWSPSSANNGIPIQPGASLKVKALVKGQNGVISTVSFPDQTYLGWWVTYRDWIRTSLTLFAALASFAITIGLLFAFAPLALLALNKRMGWIVDLIAAIPLVGTVAPIIKVLTLGAVVEQLAASDRVARQWCRAYAGGREHFSRLTESTRAQYLKKPMVLDAWVARRFESVRAHLEQKRAILGAASYIPMPVTVSVDRVTREFAQKVDAKLLRPLFKADRVALGVVGDGGIGKTTLACQIGLWLMRGGRTERVIREHPTLAVMLHGNVDNVLDATRAELNVAFLDQDGLATSDEVLKAALESRRLCVIVDGLSEMTEESQDHVESIFSAGKSFRLLIYTARRPYPSILDQWVEVAPEQVTLTTVNHFVSQYLHEVGLPDDAPPEEGPEITRKVIELVRHRFGETMIPQAFVVLFVDIIRLTRASLDALPVSLPSTVQSYVQNLKLGGDSDVSQDLVLPAASLMATLTLGEQLIPREFPIEAGREILKAEFPGMDADTILRGLLQARLLVERMSATGKMLGFRLDPIAEYLAAAQAVRSISSLEEWESYFSHVKSLAGTTGFERSLIETVVASADFGGWRAVARDQLAQEASQKAG